MIKRLFDFTLASLALVALGPLLIPIALVLRFTGEGEIFYRQTRLGRDAKPFGILKFATMLKNSPSMAGGDISTRDDPRILPVGRLLRSTKINELPQLINIVVGDMSLIGPRPFTPGIAALFDVDHSRAVAHLRPGLSGIGSIVFRDEERLLAGIADRMIVYKTAIVPYKAALEHWYGSHQSLGLDLKLIGLTVLAVLRPALHADRFFADLPAEPAELVALRKRARALAA